MSSSLTIPASALRRFATKHSYVLEVDADGEFIPTLSGGRLTIDPATGWMILCVAVELDWSRRILEDLSRLGVKVKATDDGTSYIAAFLPHHLGDLANIICPRRASTIVGSSLIESTPEPTSLIAMATDRHWLIGRTPAGEVSIACERGGVLMQQGEKIIYRVVCVGASAKHAFRNLSHLLQFAETSSSEFVAIFDADATLPGGQRLMDVLTDATAGVIRPLSATEVSPFVPSQEDYLLP